MFYLEKHSRTSKGTFGEMFKEHLKAPSSLYDHPSSIGNSTSVDNFNILGMERHNFARTIKESIYIKLSIIRPSPGTLVRKNCHTYGIEFCLPFQYSKINNQGEYKELQVHNTTLVLSTPRSIVENISCRLDEAIL